jgi:small nuclear ribonucleoprotein (snRNP)-like protein
VELKNGEVYKGLLAEAEDTMNCQMKEGEKRRLNLLAAMYNK